MTVGGTPDVRELTHLTITKLAVDKEMSNNAYLLRCRTPVSRCSSTQRPSPTCCSR